MADQPHAEVPRQPEEGHDGHDNRSVASEISEGQADTAAELTSTMTSYAKTRSNNVLLNSGTCSKFSGWLPSFL